jgi:hypothetical protein
MIRLHIVPRIGQRRIGQRRLSEAGSSPAAKVAFFSPCLARGPMSRRFGGEQLVR